MSKITWNDLFSGTFKYLKKTYKINDTQLECLSQKTHGWC